MCGSSGSATSTTEFKAPDYTQAGWQDLLSNAQNLTSQPMNQYTGMQTAPLNAQQLQAQTFSTDRALNGAPDLNAGRGAATDIASGQYFNNSPWTDPSYTNNVINQNANTMANAAAIGQNAQDDSMFARSGAYGGSAWAAKQGQNSLALNNSIGQMANNYQLQNAQMGNSNYQNGVNQMLQAGQLGGQLSQDDWQAAQALQNNGAQTNQYQQSLLNNDQQNFNQQNQYPYQQLQQMNNILSSASGNYGQTTSNPYSGSGSLLTGLLGGAAAGYGLLS